MMRTRKIVIGMGIWLVLGALLSFRGRIRSTPEPPTEIATGNCAIAYPTQDLPDSAGKLAHQPPQQDALAATKPADQAAIPPIDAAAPTRTEMATFAIG